MSATDLTSSVRMPSFRDTWNNGMGLFSKAFIVLAVFIIASGVIMGAWLSTFNTFILAYFYWSLKSAELRAHRAESDLGKVTVPWMKF